MNKHTPGPWMVHSKISDSVVTVKGGSIADCVGAHSTNEKLANARLIAAAPEMLDALNFTVSYLLELSPNVSEALNVLKAAIIKAEGQNE